MSVEIACQCEEGFGVPHSHTFKDGDVGRGWHWPDRGRMDCRWTMQLHREHGHPEGYDGPCWGPLESELEQARSELADQMKRSGVEVEGDGDG